VGTKSNLNINHAQNAAITEMLAQAEGYVSSPGELPDIHVGRNSTHVTEENSTYHKPVYTDRMNGTGSEESR
jgi:hypothetical protein